MCIPEKFYELLFLSILCEYYFVDYNCIFSNICSMWLILNSMHDKSVTSVLCVLPCSTSIKLIDIHYYNKSYNIVLSNDLHHIKWYSNTIYIMRIN